MKYLRYLFLVGLIGIQALIPLTAHAETQYNTNPIGTTHTGLISNTDAGTSFANVRLVGDSIFDTPSDVMAGIYAGNTSNKFDSIYRGLMSFDLDGELPVNKTVLSATITVDIESCNNTYTQLQAYALYAGTPDSYSDFVLSDWDNWTVYLLSQAADDDELEAVEGSTYVFTLTKNGINWLENHANSDVAFYFLNVYDHNNISPTWYQNQVSIVSINTMTPVLNIVYNDTVPGSGGIGDDGTWDDIITGGGGSINNGGSLFDIFDDFGTQVGLSSSMFHIGLILMLIVLTFFVFKNNSVMKFIVPSCVFIGGMIIGWVPVWMVVLIALGAGLFIYKFVGSHQ